MVKQFCTLYFLQMQFQQKVEGVWPCDNPVKFQYHMNAMQEELGEVLKADKRWKTHRNVDYLPSEKLDEVADCFITMFNIAMWSGFSPIDILGAIENKIAENNKRVDAEGCK